jgi:hypothetical protein
VAGRTVETISFAEYPFSPVKGIEAYVKHQFWRIKLRTA